MNISKVFLYLSTSIFILALVGCSSTPAKNENYTKSEDVKYKGAFSEVSIDFSQDAENVFNSSDHLDLISFNTTILDELDSKGLISSNSKFSLSIIIDKVNIHPKSASSYIDSLDIPDSISGTLVIKDGNQHTNSQYQVSKEFRSGTLSAQDNDLLYQQFAELTSNLLAENSTTGDSASTTITNSQNTANTKQSSGGYKFIFVLAALLGFVAGFGAF
jgi:hypothetical protein